MRLCFVGPMVGRNPGFVTTQGEILSDKLAEEGYPVVSVSSSPRRLSRLREIVETLIRLRNEIDVLVLQVYSGPSFVVDDIASLLGRRFGHRIVMHLHGGGIPDFMARFPVYTRRVLSRADVLVAPSEFLARTVRAHGLEAEIISNVIDTTEYPYQCRRAVAPRLLWMRSFHPIYNPLMAIRVLAEVKERFPGSSLVMAGQDKGLQRETQRLARRMGLQEAVRFPGFLTHTGKVRESRACDIFINTNRIDNTPVAVLEACAMGLPVVSTDVGGVPDLLTHEENGLLVPDGSSHAMAEMVIRLVEQPALAEKLSCNGRLLAENSSWQAVRPRWEQLLERLHRPVPLAVGRS